MNIQYHEGQAPNADMNRADALRARYCDVSLRVDPLGIYRARGHSPRRRGLVQPLSRQSAEFRGGTALADGGYSMLDRYWILIAKLKMPRSIDMISRAQFLKSV
ncbi:hypothetical protein TPY_3105 [Sulfobacillus acidophilus TPY]|nr:hypothetical protein TPY_3105 [Sulfobacillus acidophilus TPY]